MRSRTRDVIVLSLHPKFAQMIYQGTKTVELRKILPTRRVTRVLIYETAPVSKVTGVLEISWARRMPVREIWRRFSTRIRVSWSDFRLYLGRRKVAVVIGIGSRRRFKKAFGLRDIARMSSPPQSFRYARVAAGLANPRSA
jgi:predicted transcriptional regulator